MRHRSELLPFGRRQYHETWRRVQKEKDEKQSERKLAPGVERFMKKNHRSFLVLALTVNAFATSSLVAVESEAELMKQAKISRPEAEKIALAKVPQGKIQSGEIENEHHALVWSFDISNPGTKDIIEVLVNAKTGKIIDVSKENPAAQAQEHAADAAANHR